MIPEGTETPLVGEVLVQGISGKLVQVGVSYQCLTHDPKMISFGGPDKSHSPTQSVVLFMRILLWFLKFKSNFVGDLSNGNFEQRQMKQTGTLRGWHG